MKMGHCIAAAFLLALLAASPSWGLTEQASDNGPAVDSLFSTHEDGPGLWRVMAGAGLVCAVALFGYLQWHRKVKGKASEVKIISVTPVGQKEKIALIEVMGERLVLGVTSQQISLIYRKGEGRFQDLLDHAGEQ